MTAQPVSPPVSPVQLASLEKALVGGLPELLDELAARMSDTSDGYASFLIEHRDVVLSAAEGTIRSLLVIAEDSLVEAGGTVLRGTDPDIYRDGDRSPWDEGLQRDVFEEIGRIQWRQGTPVGTLLSAYQLGARVTWRRLSQHALTAGLPPTALAALAEAVFCFVDQLSSASAAGYLSEQSEAAAARERSRDELVDLLLSDRSDTTAIAAAAARAGWLVPATAAVVFVEESNALGRDMVERLDRTCLPIRRPGLLGAVAPGRRDRLTAALHNSSAVVGHTVSLDRLPASARIAEEASRLQRAGILSDDPVFVDEHLDAIIVNREPRLLEALRQQTLAAFDDLTPTSRAVLRETLRSWLRHMGDRKAVAEELHVHPQTVRYRLGRLRELFGSDLDDPDARLRLTLALAWGP
jgi:hypothetical protein